MKRVRFCYVIGILFGALVATAETAPLWPDGSPQQLSEDVFGLRLRVAREFKGDKGAEKFLRKEFAKHPSTAATAYMAWVCFYGKGWGMPSLVDPERGKTLALEAIDAGSPLAMDVYGRAAGQGLVPGLSAGAKSAIAVTWLRQAVEQGVPRAMARLGWYSAIGYGTLGNPVYGRILAERAAELGMPDGLVDIAGSYERGEVGFAKKPDPDLAMTLYYKAALHGSSHAWRRLAEWAKTDERANRLYQTARVHEANDGAWMLPKKTRGLVEELEKIAGDDPIALVELGEAHLVGYYAELDYELAKNLFQRAADQDSKDARFFLAKMRIRGFAGPKEPGPALDKIQALAKGGNVRAMAYLGYMYYWGASEVPGVRKDKDLAFYYVRRAAEKGDVWSLVNLATCYEHGIGTPENSALAAKVYWQAFLRGYQPGLLKTRRHLAFVKS